MLRSGPAAILAVLSFQTIFGQGVPPAFEVASVKPSTPVPGSAIGLFTYPGGRIVASNYTLRMLIHEAYDIEDYRILSGPRWVDEDRYNIEAKPSESSESSKWVPANFKTPPNPEMRQMLQTLLADRFQLKVHTEAKKESVYALVVAKGGPKLKTPTTTKEPFVSFGRVGSVDKAAVLSTLNGQNATIAQLVERLATVVKRKVLDQTDLKGNFDFQLEYAADLAQSDAGESVFQALQDQLGLKLETQPGSTDVLVIDHAEKPSGN
jgi:uncharacterized protein (TIGR03435 family)